MIHSTRDLGRGLLLLASVASLFLAGGPGSREASSSVAFAGRSVFRGVDADTRVEVDDERGLDDRYDEAQGRTEIDTRAGSSLIVRNGNASRAQDFIGDFAGDSGGGRFLRHDVPAGRSRLIYLDEEQFVSKGLLSAWINGRSLDLRDALARTDWQAGGAILDAGARAAESLRVPYVVKRGPRWSSQILIQSQRDSSTRSFTLAFVPNGALEPLEPRYGLSFGRGRFLVDLAGDAKWKEIPEGWVGSLRISSEEAATAKVIQARPGDWSAVADYDVQGDRAGRRLALPVLTRDWGRESLGYEIAIFNPGPVPAQVGLDLFGVDGSCAGQRYRQDGPMVAQHEIRFLRSGDGPLPEDCAAVGILQSGQEVIAVVTLADVLGSRLAAYSAAVALDEPRPLHAPFLRKREAPAAGHGLLFISNTSEQPANLLLLPRSLEGDSLPCGPACSLQIDPTAGLLWDPALVDGLPVGRVFEVEIQSDLAIAAGVLDHGDARAGPADPSAYLAFAPNSDSQQVPLLPMVISGPAPRYGSSEPEGPEVSSTPVISPSTTPEPTTTLTPSITPTPSNTPTPSPSITPGPSPTPSDTPTRRPNPGPYPPPPPGREVRLSVVASVDVMGGENQDCPGCDGIYDPVDELFAQRHPLGAVGFELLDEEGGIVARATTQAQGAHQVAALRIPAPGPDAPYRIRLRSVPDGWSSCEQHLAQALVRNQDFSQDRGSKVIVFFAGCPAELEPPQAPNLDLDRDARSMILAINHQAVEPIDLWSLLLPRDLRRLPVRLERMGLGAGRVADFGLRERFESRSSGQTHGAEVDATGPFSAVARLDWDSGGAAMYDPPVTARQLLLADLSHRPGSEVSAIALQNPDQSHAAHIGIELIRDGASAPLRSIFLELPQRGGQTLRLDRLAASRSLPADFRGWARIHADRPVAALAISDIEDRIGVWSLPALAESELTDSLVLPAVYIDSSASLWGKPAWGIPRLRSELRMVNPSHQAVDVDITLRGHAHFSRDARCDELEAALPRKRVEGHAVVHMSDAEMGLPAGCVAHAWIASTGGPILASLRLTDIQSGSTTAYLAIPTAAGYADTAIPLIRAGSARSGMATALHLVNLDDEPISVQLDSRAVDGRQIALRSDIAVGAALRWWPDDPLEPLEPDDPISYGQIYAGFHERFAGLLLDLPHGTSRDIASHRLQDRSGDQGPAVLPLLALDTAIEPEGPGLVAPDAVRPLLVLPSHPPRAESGRLAVPIRLLGSGLRLGRIDLVLGFQGDRMVFDDRDHDADGRPDGLQSSLPEGYEISIVERVAGPRSRLHLRIEASRDGLLPIPDGEFLRIGFGLLGPRGELGWSTDSSLPATSTRGQDGVPYEPILVGGWAADWQRIHLPLLLQAQ